MRPIWVLVVLVLSSLPVAARSGLGSHAPSHHPLDLSAIGSFNDEDANATARDLPLIRPSTETWSHGLTLPSLSLGPLHAEIGGAASGDVTRAHIASYKLQGVDVLGSTISGHVDGRSAKVLFVWPTGH